MRPKHSTTRRALVRRGRRYDRHLWRRYRARTLTVPLAVHGRAYRRRVLARRRRR